MDNFTTVSLPRDISPKDLATLQKRCHRILRHGDLRLDGSAVESLDFFGETFLADIATAAENLNRRCVLKGFAAPIREKLSKLTVNIVPPKDDSQKMSFIEKLGEREKKIIYLRYFRAETQSEVAEGLGISQVQVSRIENKVLEKLKEKFDL